MRVVDLDWKFEEDILIAEVRFLKAAVGDTLAHTPMLEHEGIEPTSRW